MEWEIIILHHLNFHSRLKTQLQEIGKANTPRLKKLSNEVRKCSKVSRETEHSKEHYAVSSALSVKFGESLSG